MPFPTETGTLCILTIKQKVPVCCKVSSVLFLSSSELSWCDFYLFFFSPLSHMIFFVLSFVLHQFCVTTSQHRTHTVISLNEQTDEQGAIKADGICPIYDQNHPQGGGILWRVSHPSSQSVAAFRQLQSSLNDFKWGIQNWLPRNASSSPFQRNVMFPCDLREAPVPG